MPDFFTALLIVCAIVVLYVLNCIKILREYERGVIFTLGRVSPQPYGPGIIFVFKPIQQMVRISLRQDVLEVPPQDVITRDNVTIKVNAVVTLYVVNPNDAAIKVANYVYQTSQLAQTTLRTVLGEVELDELHPLRRGRQRPDRGVRSDQAQSPVRRPSRRNQRRGGPASAVGGETAKRPHLADHGRCRCPGRRTGQVTR